MPKLYKVRTHGEELTREDNVAGYKDVVIHWFREWRTEPAYPYTWMVPGWEDMISSLDPSERNPIYAKKLASYVDQLFTLEEALALREHFLLTRAADVELEGIEIPLTDFEIPFRLIPPDPQAGENYGFINMPSGPGHPVPFPIAGYFDIQYATAYQRHQMATVKTLMESSGLSLADTEISKSNDLKSLCEKISSLHDALVLLQQTLTTLTNPPTAEGQEAQ